MSDGSSIARSPRPRVPGGAPMKERPILFSGPMIRALLDGRKSQTRRIVRPQPEHLGNGWTAPGTGDLLWADGNVLPHGKGACPHGAPGDRLWVKETFSRSAPCYLGGKAQPTVWYAADNNRPLWATGKWKPSIFMPRAASRITLEVTRVRVERLQSISEEDARAEGVTITTEQDDDDGPIYSPARYNFKRLWEQLNNKRAPWASNPWVWVVEFKRVQP